MCKKWILVMDSGKGGFYTLNKIKQRLPNENYLYFMDVLHAPYGNKSIKKLTHIADEIIKKFLRRFDIKLIVFACNTLSSVSYEYLQKKYFNIPIIKIEPILDKAKYHYKPTLVLATNNTIKHNKKIIELKNYKYFYFYGFKTLAKKIDNKIEDCSSLQPYLNKKLKRYKNKNIKNIVLGCTHFNYIKNELLQIFGNDINFFENSSTVAKNVEDTLKFSGLKSRQKKFGKTVILRNI